MLLHVLEELVGALAGGGDRERHRWPPAGELTQVQHVLQVAPGVGGPGPVGLVDHEDVRHLQQAGLVGLHGVAPARAHRHDRGVGGAGDVHLHLADAHGLHDDEVVPGGVEQPDRRQRRQGQPPRLAAARHGAHERSAGHRRAAHPHPVAEDGAAGQRGRGIHRQDGHPPAVLGGNLREAVGEGGLADARCAGHAHNVGGSGERPGGDGDGVCERPTPLGVGQQPPERPPVAVAGPLEQGGDVVCGAGRPGRSCRRAPGRGVGRQVGGHARAAAAARTTSATSAAEAPGPRTAKTPASASRSRSTSGTIPPTTTGTSRPAARTASTMRGASVR